MLWSGTGIHVCAMKSPKVLAMVIAGGKGERGRGVRIDAGAQIEGCILLDWVHIGSQARLCRASADRSTVIPPRSRVGIDAVNDPKAVPCIPIGARRALANVRQAGSYVSRLITTG